MSSFLLVVRKEWCALGYNAVLKTILGRRQSGLMKFFRSQFYAVRLYWTPGR